MISPIRRMAHSFSTNALDWSALDSTSVGREVELPLLPRHLAGDRHLGRPAFLVAADEHQLLALEQVAHVPRIKAVDRLALLDGDRIELEPDGDIGDRGRP